MFEFHFYTTIYYSILYTIYYIGKKSTETFTHIFLHVS